MLQLRSRWSACGAERAGRAATTCTRCRTPSGEARRRMGGAGLWPGTASLRRRHVPAQAARSSRRSARPTRTANTDIATWAFEAPAGETLAGATLWRAGDADGGAAATAAYEFWLAGPSRNRHLRQNALAGWHVRARGNLAQPLSAENRVVVPACNLGAHLYVNASCGGIARFKCTEGEARPQRLRGGRLPLRRRHGARTDRGPRGGQRGRRTGERADGARHERSGVHARGIRARACMRRCSASTARWCRARWSTKTGALQERGADGGRAAGVPVRAAVPASVSADVGFDTTRVANGAHHLVVSVIDAAGNAAPVLDRQITVANPPRAPGPPNGDERIGAGDADGRLEGHAQRAPDERLRRTRRRSRAG